MKEREFWGIIGMLNWDKAGNDDLVVAPIVHVLSQKTDNDIYQFEEFLAEKLFALDTKAHAQEIGDEAYQGDEEDFSVDNFLYARCAVVANGQELFEKVLDNPAEFPKDIEFEALLFVAQEAFEQKNEDDWSYVANHNYETFSNLEGWKED